jgi:hypothetical protein
MTDLNNLPSNNIQAPNTTKKLAFRGSVRQEKAGSNLASEVRDIFNSQFSNMMLPSIMRLVYDFLEGALRMMILGDGPGTGPKRYGGRTSYHSTYRQRPNQTTYHRGDRHQRYGHTPRVIQDSPYQDIFFGIHQEAEDVLNIMKDTIHEYGWCSVGHLYSICGITNNHTHHSWGWTDVTNVGIGRADRGFFIDLPNPVAK